MQEKIYKRALTIAGSDSGGGAGIQADLKTFAALGCYGMSVITALTAQNTLGVTGIHAVPPAFAGQQLEAVLTDIGTDAVKIGMLFSIDLIDVVAEHLQRHRIGRIVLDPVMVAQSGDKLIQDDAIQAIMERLVPLADVITPNLTEAGVMLGRDVETEAEMGQAARDLARMGVGAVLIKGGHRSVRPSLDMLYLAEFDTLVTLEEEHILTRNNHGTGCTLSSAIAAYLAAGNSVEVAVRMAKQYLTHAMREGTAYRLGAGSGPVHHFYRYWQARL